MTRGCHANHAYTATDGPGHHDTGPDEPVPTGRQILAQIMATHSNQSSAAATLRARHARATPGADVALIGLRLAARQDDARPPYTRQFPANPVTPSREGPAR